MARGARVRVGFLPVEKPESLFGCRHTQALPLALSRSVAGGAVALRRLVRLAVALDEVPLALARDLRRAAERHVAV